MKILDEELEFDFLDADYIEKLENATQKAQKELNNINENKPVSQLIRETCKIIDKCFNDIFGEKTSEKVFKGKFNIKLYMTAFRELIEEKDRQEKEFDEEYKNLSKYLPNRKTRRQK